MHIQFYWYFLLYFNIIVYHVGKDEYAETIKLTNAAIGRQKSIHNDHL